MNQKGRNTVSTLDPNPVNLSPISPNKMPIVDGNTRPRESRERSKATPPSIPDTEAARNNSTASPETQSDATNPPAWPIHVHCTHGSAPIYAYPSTPPSDQSLA